MPTPADRLLTDIGNTQPLLDEYVKITQLRADYKKQADDYTAKRDALQARLDEIVIQIRALAPEMRDAWGGVV